jgi:uncharacterized repeat protein (TIGR01451 family)
VAGNPAQTNLGFSEDLPAGLTVTDAAAIYSSCSTFSDIVTTGATSVNASFSLRSGQGSCAVSIPVVASSQGTYTDGSSLFGVERGLRDNSSATLNCSSKVTLSKRASSPTANPGQIITYTVTATNNSSSALTSKNPATFTDSLVNVLPDATYVVGSASATNGAVSYSAGTGISWRSTNLGAKKSATITYQVQVKNPDPGPQLMMNTVVSTDSGTNCPRSSSNSSCSTRVTITNPAPLLDLRVGGATLLVLAAAGAVLVRRRRRQFA